MKILIGGASGFLGTHLVPVLRDAGHEVVAIRRAPSDRTSRGMAEVGWDEDVLARELEDAGAVVNLAGANLFARRWSPAFKEELRRSRIETTRMLVRALGRASRRPSVFVSGSAVGYYGPRQAEELGELAASGGDFLALLCEEWEREARAAEALAVRVVRLRTGMVLGRGGGALGRMALPYRLFAGGTVGSGRQWISWIHVQDLVAMIRFAIENDAVRGALNATAPGAVPMREFCRTLARVLHRPNLFPAPAFLLRLALGEVAQVVTTGQRALPRKALDRGFSFCFPDLEPALRDLLG